MIVQRRVINRLPTLRGQMNLCREHISRLAQQNVRFSKENDRLEAEKNRLQEIESQLAQTVEISGGNVMELKRLVKENGDIQKQMMEIQKAQELQQVMKAIFASDTNMDFQLTEEEFDRLIMRLKCFNVVAQDRIREALMKSSMGKSITSVYRDLEEEILNEDPILVSTRALQVDQETSCFSAGQQCLESDPSFVYARCMD